ncbi:MAG: methyltransferase domain-containing protein [candidate division Zixibacteria bacterium]|nr:methyltransferase domain-containing protein [candidate division Zixibacteria bacterium]
MDLINCPVCKSTDLEKIYDACSAPVYCNLLWDDRESAVNCPKGSIQLQYCRRCGYIFNSDFDTELLDYDVEYENSLHFSRKFETYAQSLAQRLVEHYRLYDKKIIEIGCGRGDFLKLLCKLGDNHGIGFDPSYHEGTVDNDASGNIIIIKDYYGGKYSSLEPDFILARQTVEHIPDPVKFLRTILATTGNKTIPLFIEVPNMVYTLKNMFIWDIIYEHYSYFTPISVNALLAMSGYNASLISDEFGGQFMGAHAIPGEGEIIDGSIFDKEVDRFKCRYPEWISEWKAQVKKDINEGKNIVVWGSGSKGVTFLNILGMGSGIEYAVDINPRKNGRYIAGTGQKIISPQQLIDVKPDIVLIMNPLYEQEIRSTLANLKIDPQVMII